MQKISNYTIVEKLGETRKSEVYRCFLDNPQETRVIKVFRAASPTPSEIARFRYEYDLIKTVDNANIVKPIEIIVSSDGLALVLEDFNGISLKELLKRGSISIEAFLHIAIALSGTLGYLHQKKIIHRDIKPANIIVNENLSIVKLTDFGIAMEITHERDEIYNPSVIEGTLVYMSPEQTGRMNRDVDYRTDLYSLGITLYELLVGTVPFRSKDPMELIHAHIAREAPAPMTINTSIPETISNIVMKLLSKTAEDRYQNGFGLQTDLKKCMQQMRADGRITSFPLGEQDISIRFSIPRKLFGRDQEMRTILGSFDRTCQGSCEMVVVAGNQGVGKTALVNEINRPIVERRGYYIWGKYDQFRSNVPHSAIIQAFQSLMRQILTQSEAMVAALKERLLKALGPNSQIIIDIIPEVELIIGKQPAVAALGPDESKNRFNHVLRSFISVFASEEHPLVLFLDDMQWCDGTSLSLLKTLLINSEIKYVLLICSYRDTEIKDSQAFLSTCTDIETAGIKTERFSLQPLGIEYIIQLISNCLRSDETNARELADIIQKKTNGNPFFMSQFLQRLYDEELLELDPAKGWRWDNKRVRALEITDNVVDLMLSRLSGLPGETRELLKICACIGSYFDPDMLSTLSGKAIDGIIRLLNGAADDGLLTPSGNNFQFQHDRIEEAVYSLLSEDERVRLHYRIGNLVLDKTGAEELPDKIFYIVKNLNYGSPLITQERERTRLAELNLMAGKKAKASTAYDAAVNFLTTGTQFLPPDSWQTRYDLTYQLYAELGECEYLSTNFNRADELFDIIMKHARTIIHKAEIYYTKAILYAHENKHDEGTTVGIEGLRLFGIRIPKNPKKPAIMMEIVKSKFLLRGKKIEDLYDVPNIEDPYIESLIKLYYAVVLPAFYVNIDLYILLSLKMFNVTIRYGNSDYAPFAYIVYAMILNRGMGDYASGYRFGKLAVRMADKINIMAISSAIYTSFGGFINSWTNHGRTSIEYVLKGHQFGVEGGNPLMATAAFVHISTFKIIIGEQCAIAKNDVDNYCLFVQRAKDTQVLLSIMFMRQMLLGLMGQTESPASFTSNNFNEEEKVKGFTDEMPIALSSYYWIKMRSLYLFHDNRAALDIAKALDANREYIAPSIMVADHYFYYSLVMTALYADASRKEQRRFLKLIQRNQKKMKKWAGFCADNFLHKYQLVQAELARVKGHEKEAIGLYDIAIDSARTSGYIHNQAIACERAGEYCLARKDTAAAREYLSTAHKLYEKWGAFAKSKHLENIHAGLIYTAPARRSAPHPDDTDTLSTSTAAVTLDLHTALKASQSISGEIVLGKLLERIMHILVENAGAQRGVFILESNGALFIEAEYNVSTGVITVLQSMPVAGSKEVPESIVQYAYRTREDVIVHDAAREGGFTADEYVVSHSSKSIMCTPIMNRGAISGILYMENNLSAGAFVVERLELLRIISSQVAVSIDNARLYANLEDKVRERTAELKQARDALWGEMQLAKKIQTVLLPQRPAIKGYEIAAYMNPADEVGGDYYDIINAGGMDWVLIGDVSGHGVTSGLVMMMVQTAVDVVIREYPGLHPSELLQIINRTITKNIRQLGENKYMTITALAAHEQGRFVFSGLHLDIMIYRAKSGTVDIVETNGMWIGIMDDIKGTVSDDMLVMNSGDVMLLYTDGLTEAWMKKSIPNQRDPDSAQFGDERLKNILQKLGTKPPDAIKDGIIDALDNYTCVDDITLVVVKKG